jgi:hypothetical protein
VPKSLPVPTEADAFVIVETLNDRGADLTIGDLRKNYLFMRAGRRLDTVKSSLAAAPAGLDISAENELFISFSGTTGAPSTAQCEGVSSTAASRLV